jgi:IclR family transcriptional regulator, pca regulon regulatory protein
MTNVDENAENRPASKQMRGDDSDFIMSLARGLDVLQAFSRKWKHLSMAQISRVTGIPRASVGRCLHTLSKLGYVAVDDERRYFLLPKVMQLSHAYTSSNRLLGLAQPLLDRMAEEFGEACSLAVLDGDEIIYLARALSSRILSLKLNVGGRAPLYCSAIGLVALANYSEDALEDYLRNVHFVRYSEFTVVDPMKLKDILAAIRSQSYAISSQQRDVTIDAIAVPLHDKGGTVFGGVNVITRNGSIPLAQLPERFLPGLRKTASELEKLFNEHR